MATIGIDLDISTVESVICEMESKPEGETNMLFSFDGRRPVVGNGTYVSETAQVIGDVVIGDRCYIGHGAILRGDYGRIEIGQGTAVEEGVIVHAPPEHTYRIGNNVTVGHGAILHGACIGDFSVIGMGAVLSIFSEIGEWVIVAEGSIVKMRQIIASNLVVAGNPAKNVRETSAKDKDMWSQGKELYVNLAGKYLELGMHKRGASWI